MEDYIKREDAIKVLADACEKCMWNLNGHDDDEFPVCKTCYVTYSRNEVNAIPSEDVAPVVHGKWNEKKGLYEVGYKCSVCGEISCCKGNFCPDCGADMRSE